MITLWKWTDCSGLQMVGDWGRGWYIHKDLYKEDPYTHGMVQSVDFSDSATKLHVIKGQEMISDIVPTSVFCIWYCPAVM